MYTRSKTKTIGLLQTMETTPTREIRSPKRSMDVGTSELCRLQKKIKTGQEDGNEYNKGGKIMICLKEVFQIQRIFQKKLSKAVYGINKT